MASCIPRGCLVSQPHYFVRHLLTLSDLSQGKPLATHTTKRSIHDLCNCSSSSIYKRENAHSHHQSHKLLSKSSNGPKFSNWPSISYRRQIGSVPKNKKLFTPGPLGVTLNVKEAMMRDVGSRDTEFIDTVVYIREKLLDIAGVADGAWSCIPIQGSGTFAIDAAFQTFLPREGGKALIIENGAYGKRMTKICQSAGIECHVQSFKEDERVDPEVVGDALRGRTKYDLISIVHCETSSGVINPVQEVGKLVHDLMPDATYLLDGISSFGAVPLDLHEAQVDVFVSSANKCFQGVPGFAFVIAKNNVIDKCEGNSLSLSLDLYDQVKQLDKTNQFRFTPATHSMLAFKRALVEFEEEGRVEGRGKRYAKNRDILKAGMAELGFKELLDEKSAGYIITSYLYPKDPNFSFKEFYERLNEKDLVIYPGKVLDTDCFRIGSIGDLHPEDMKTLLVAVRQVCKDMNMKIPIQY